MLVLTAKMAGRVICMLLILALVLECTSQQGWWRRRRRRSRGESMESRSLTNMPAKLPKLDAKKPNSEPQCPLQTAENKIGTCLEENLGMEDGRILDSSITASSVYQNLADYGPQRARLNTEGSWVAEDDDRSPWIQVDFKTNVRVTGLITQGRPDADEWVTVYEVAYSQDGKAWSDVTDTKGELVAFKANKDRDTQVSNPFPTTGHAKHLRIMPAAWYGRRSMRFEVVGCQLYE